MPQDRSKDPLLLTRRRLLTGGLALTAASATDSALARTLHGEVPWTAGPGAAPAALESARYEFFTPAEAAFVEAAAARLIPADDLGPGAREAGCARFIDHQLAGGYGRAERWFMQGPWTEGASTQGPQSRLNPAQLYRLGVRAVDEYCGSAFQGKTFAGLPAGQQDALLSDLENGKVELDGVKANAFFAQLLTNTVEGFFADPIYGGNRDMIGWKLIGFPGARYDHRDFVERHNQRYLLPPVGLRGRADWTPKV